MQPLPCLVGDVAGVGPPLFLAAESGQLLPGRLDMRPGVGDLRPLRQPFAERLGDRDARRREHDGKHRRPRGERRAPTRGPRRRPAIPARLPTVPHSWQALTPALPSAG